MRHLVSHRTYRWLITLTLTSVFVLCNLCSADPPAADSTTTDSAATDPLAAARRASLNRAVQWLSNAVPAWTNEHHCGACHHQGDAARALLLAIEVGVLQESSMLASTIDWCVQPDKWQQQVPDPRANDHRLAEIQFASTLGEFETLFELEMLRESSEPSASREAILRRNRSALEVAAAKLLKSQNGDGSWNIDNAGDLASPITQGPILLTGNAARVLRQSSQIDHRRAADRAWRWLCEQRPQNVFEASSLLIALWSCCPSPDQPWPKECEAARQACRLLLHKVEESDLSIDGKTNRELQFGPYIQSSGENFDTAIALIAMVFDDAALHRNRIESAARFLLRRQQADGSWDETTRLSDVESYAHRTSTTAWVTQALLWLTASRESYSRLPRK